MMCGHCDSEEHSTRECPMVAAYFASEEAANQQAAIAVGGEALDEWLES